MTNKINLLIVEDNTEQIKLYRDTIDDFNRMSNIEIKVEISNNLKDGLEQIMNREGFDAAIIDLRLDSTDTEGSGKQIIREIKGNLRFPIFVVTGYPGDLDEDLSEENYFYRIYERTEDTHEVLKEITDIYKTGITRIMGSRGIIEEKLVKIFWGNIAENMGYWKNGIIEEEKVEKILSRHILAYLTESLKLTEEGEFEKCHPAEVYIIPPVKTYCFTGDILKNKNTEEYFLILTPACDMVLRKKKENVECETYTNAEKIILVKLIKFNQNSDVRAYIDDPNNKTKIKAVESYIKNKKKERYYFLPSFGSQIPVLLIDFQDINGINPEDLNTYDRVASIHEPFLKDIIVKFTSYYARQGSPDLDIDIILKSLIND